MKKRTVSLLVVSAMCVLFAGCGNSSSATPDSASKKSEETTTIEQATTLAPTTVPPTTVQPTTVHTHQWEDVTSTVHHEAETKSVWVVDTPEKVESVTKTTAVCNICGTTFKYESGAEPAYNNMQQHLAYERNMYDLKREQWKLGSGSKPTKHPKMIKTEEIANKTIPEEGHYENQTTKEAYDETVVTGQKCKTCGEYRAKGNNQSD